MTLPTWPASLPAFNVDGYTRRPQTQGVRFEPDFGPAKQRRRTRSGPQKLALTLDVDATQLATFWTFWETDLAGGSLPFLLVDPVRGGAARRFQFVVGEEPVETCPLPHFTLSFTLERLV